MRFLPLILLLGIAPACHAFCQDSIPLSETLTHFPSRFINKIDNKASRLEDKVLASTQKYLQRLANREARLKRKLSKIDSSAANDLFDKEEYSRLANAIKTNPVSWGKSTGEYLPNIDSIKTSLTFLSKNGNLLSASGVTSGKVNNTLAQVQQLQSKFKDAEQVKQFIKQRKQQIKETLSKYTHLPKSISKDLERYKKDAYYYSQQIRGYKELLNDPGKLEQKALGVLQKLPAFQQFMREHSELAGLFRMPADYGTPQSMAGLQTRTQIQQLIQNQLSTAGANGQQMLQQNIQQAQAKLSQLKDKLSKLGGGSSDMDMPEFKPNNQKTKSFLQRLEYGTNLQTIKSNYFFPTTSDVALSIGYKLNDKSVIGIGASYKVGWGKDIRHINITHEGIGVRSYADVQLKGSFYVSGGFEYNYQPLAVSISPSVGGGQGEAWQQSGLLGISKIVSLKSKLFKKTKLQLLWDFLSYQQVPRTQAVKFRVGYNF